MDWRQAEREHDDEMTGETTVPRMFFDAVEQFGDDVCQRYKGGVFDRSLVEAGVVPAAPDGEYAALTYREVGEIVRALAAGFRELGVEPDDPVAIYADSRMEWSQADLALLAAGGVVTTVYTESSPSQVRYLLEDPGATGVVVEDAALLETVLSAADDLDLEFFVVLEAVEHDRDDVYSLGEVHALGADERDAVDDWLAERDWEDLASLIYTSGTTGDPKGVPLTHENLRTDLNQIRTRLGPREDRTGDVVHLDRETVALSFLPLAHVMERMNHLLLYSLGATIAYAESPDTFGDDIQQVEPTYAAAVPRVHERVYAKVRDQAAESPVKERIFRWAVATGRAYDAADDPGALLEAKQALADRLVFSKVREALGGNVELFLSGGGSLSEELARFYRATGLPIVDAYGMTEAAPVLTLTPPEAPRAGTVGVALPDVELSLDPEMASEEMRDGHPGDVGELLARGPNVFDGYWNAPEATDEAFTDAEDDGEPWFRTGDVLARDEDGYHRFVDRVKNLIVLDTGKNVAPERIEDAFATSQRVEQIMVVGQDEPFVGAVVRPNFEELRAWADEEGIDLPGDEEAICDDARVAEWVSEEIQAVNEELGHHETVKEFRLVAEEWTPDNDLLTPSMKKRRRNIRAAFEEEVAAIYDRD